MQDFWSESVNFGQKYPQIIRKIAIFGIFWVFRDAGPSKTPGITAQTVQNAGAVVETRMFENWKKAVEIR